jgi:hypothetical protein
VVAQDYDNVVEQEAHKTSDHSDWVPKSGFQEQLIDYHMDNH